MDSAAALAFTVCMLAHTAAVQRESGNESGSSHGRPEALDHRTMVVVQRDWQGWRTATVMLSDLEDIRWLQPNGAPRPMIHAHVTCSKLRPGDLQHDCDLRSAPHHLLVCVLKSHTAPSVFEELARRASTSAGEPVATTHPGGVLL